MMSPYQQSPSPSAKSSFPLIILSAALLVGAASIWGYRSQRALEQEWAQRGSEASRQAQEASALLYRSYQADNTLRYRATSSTTAVINGRPVTVRAAVSRAPRQLAIKFLSGPAKGVEAGFSDGCFWRHSQAASLTLVGEGPVDNYRVSGRRLGLLLRNYALRPAGEVNLGSRVAQVVEIRPWQPVEGAAGPARRVYIDRVTGLTLGVDGYNCKLQQVLESRLSDLEILSLPTTGDGYDSARQVKAASHSLAWKGQEAGRGPEDFRSVAQSTGLEPPQPDYLPPGFELDGYAFQRCLHQGGNTLAALTRYTDGLNTLTVFATPGIATDFGGGKACPLGPVNLMARTDGRGQLVAIGDLPPQTLSRVLASAHVKEWSAH